MSIGTNIAGNAGSTGPVPGLGLALGLDSPPSARGKGQDFATVMRDLPPPASDKARQAVAKHADRKSEAPEPEEAVEARETEPASVEEKAVTGKSKHSAKSEEKGEEKSPDTPEQPSEPEAVALAVVSAQSVTGVPAEATEEQAVAVDGEKTKKPVAKISAAASQPAAEADQAVDAVGTAGIETSAKDVHQTAVKGTAAGAPEKGKAAESRLAKADQSEVKTGPAVKGEEEAVVKGNASDASAQSPEAKAPAKPGEATELLSLVKGKSEPAIENKSPEVVRPIDAKASAEGSAETEASGESDTADVKSSITPVRGQGLVTPQGKAIEGLQNAAVKASPHAAVVERVAAAQAAEAKASGAASSRSFEPPHVSSLALAAADIAQHGARDGQDTDLGRTNGLLGDAAIPAMGRGDVSSLMTRLDALGGGSVAPQVSAASSLGAAGVTGLGGALGQQVVDMGVSGQWIEDIAQTIARVADNPGQGAFRVASPSLGPVQVNITPGSQGSNIHMTVESEAARAALANDRQRLVQDAQLASVRIGDVRIDRVAALGEAHRGDMNPGGQQGQNGSQHAGAQASLSQGNGQQGRADASAMGQQSGQDSAKNPFTKAVINDAAASDRANSGKGKRGDNARYA